MLEARKWKQAVVQAVVFSGWRGPVLDKAKLTLIRHSSAEPDADGLVSSFKHCIDGLIAAKVIVNDKMSNIGFPDYRWQKAPPKGGYVEIIVESVDT